MTLTRTDERIAATRAANERRFFQWWQEAGGTVFERVGTLYHFECRDGTCGNFSLVTGTFRFHSFSYVSETARAGFNG